LSAPVDSLRINYRPPGPVSRAFLESSAFVRGIRGPFGSGKSTLCCVDVLDLSLRQRPGPDGKRRTRGAIVRQTYPELKTTTIKTWHGIIPPNIGSWTDQGPPTHLLQSDDLDCEVMFIALDSSADVKKLLSMDLTWAWINEAREVPKAVIDGLTARVGRYPSAAQGGPSWFGVLMDTNSPDTDHWWYTLAEKDASNELGRQLIESTVQAEAALRAEGLLRPDQPLFEFFSQPGGLTAGAENAENLPAGYYHRLMAGKSEDWIKVYVHGEYGFLREGRPVYPEYADHLHCAKQKLIPAAGEATVGLDFGLTPAATFSQRLVNGQLITFHELVTTRMGAKNFALELAPELARYPQCIWDIVGDPSGSDAAQTDEQTVFQVLRANGINARPARTNDFMLRREAVGNALTRLVDGQPAVLISPTCPKLRKALAGGYCLKRVQVSGEKYRDKPDKDMNSHVAESQQYAFLELGENPRAMHGAKPMPGVIHPVGGKWNVFG
jgi:hypothetical protein